MTATNMCSDFGGFRCSPPLNLFMQKKIADFSKLPFMLKSTLDHLNYIRESDASWCTAAEKAISNLETEHGLTIKGSRGPTVRKSPPLSVQQFCEYKWLFSILIH